MPKFEERPCPSLNSLAKISQVIVGAMVQMVSVAEQIHTIISKKLLADN